MNAVSQFFRHLNLGKKIAAFHTVSRCAIRLHRAIVSDSNATIPWCNPKDEWSCIGKTSKTLIIIQIFIVFNMRCII